MGGGAAFMRGVKEPRGKCWGEEDGSGGEVAVLGMPPSSVQILRCPNSSSATKLHFFEALW